MPPSSAIYTPPRHFLTWSASQLYPLFSFEILASGFTQPPTRAAARARPYNIRNAFPRNRVLYGRALAAALGEWGRDGNSPQKRRLPYPLRFSTRQPANLQPGCHQAIVSQCLLRPTFAFAYRV